MVSFATKSQLMASMFPSMSIFDVSFICCFEAVSSAGIKVCRGTQFASGFYGNSDASLGYRSSLILRDTAIVPVILPTLL